MTINPKLTTQIGGGTLIATGIAVGTTHVVTKETVWEKVKDFCLVGDLEDEEAWDKARSNLVNSSSRSGSLLSPFKELYSTLNSASSSEEESTRDSWKLLKKVCNDVYLRIRKSAIKGEDEDEEFINQVKSYCSLSYLEKIGRGNLLTSDLSNAWNKAQEKIKNGTETDLVTPFKELKEELNKTNPNTEETLEKTCTKLYSQRYRDNSLETQNLIDQINRYCKITIAEMMDSSKLFTTNSDTNEADKKVLKTKLNSLKNHNNTNGTLDEELEEIKEIVTSKEEEAIRRLKDWCLKTYNTVYKGDNYGDWKLTNTYCKKP